MRISSVLALLLVPAGLACGAQGGKDAATPESPGPATLTIFAAASTANALDEINAAFEKLAGIHVVANYAASSTLAQQILAGARADLFLSANGPWADAVENAGLAARRRGLLANRLVAIVPVGSKLALKDPTDLASPAVKLLALADPQAVPAGIYARQALERLGLWPALRARATGAFDVRQALAYVERGEADAGIVYATDAALGRRVRVAFAFDPSLTEPIVYPLLLLKNAGTSPAARRYFDRLAGPEAAEVFRHYGFVVDSQALDDAREVDHVAR